MAYSTLPSFSSGVVLPATSMNLIGSNFEAVAKAPVGWAYSTANQTVATSTSPTMNLVATYSLRNIAFASNTFTIAEAGTYLGIVHVAWGSSTVGIRVCSLVIGGVPQAASHITPGAATNWSQQTLFVPFIAAAGNLITATVFQDSGGNLALNAGSSLFIHMLSR